MTSTTIASLCRRTRWDSPITAPRAVTSSAAFLVPPLACGRVRQIERSPTQLFGGLDNALYDFTTRFDGRERARLRSFKHRFTTGDDLSGLLAPFRRVLNDYGDLESFFLRSQHGCGSEIRHRAFALPVAVFPDSSQDLFCHLHSQQ